MQFTDRISESEVTACLDRAGLKYRNWQKYIVSQCPLHDDKNPSAQIFKDDWFVNCHAKCGRFPIHKAFPELLKNNGQSNNDKVQKRSEPMPKYKDFNLKDQWDAMPMIPREHKFKNIPLIILDRLGWRWDEAKNSYFIPYFDMFRESIPFAQWRHLAGERRFTFLSEARPIVYGLWNLTAKTKLFICEGTSDGAVMENCCVPWLSLPSASSNTLVHGLVSIC